MGIIESREWHNEMKMRQNELCPTCEGEQEVVDYFFCSEKGCDFNADPCEVAIGNLVCPYHGSRLKKEMKKCPDCC